MDSCKQRSVSVSGITLRYLERAPETPSSKPPLLVLHQLLATAESLTELILRLPTDRRIVALDILSAQPASGELDTRSESLSRLVEAFAQSIHLDSPIVIGHSYGGALALWLAVHGQLDVQGIALLCPAHPFAGYRDHVVAFYLTRWGRFLALRIPIAPARMILWAYNQAAGDTRITLKHLKPHLRVLRSRKALIRVLEILRTWEADMTDLRAAMVKARLPHPTLLLWGDRDTVVPISSAPALEAHLQSSERITLPGRGHLLPEEAPDQCASLFRDWIDTLQNEPIPQLQATLDQPQ